MRTSRRIVQWCYDRFLRPHLPRKFGYFNSVLTRSPRLLDANDYDPDYEGPLLEGVRSSVESGDSVVIVGGGIGVSSVVAAERADSGPVTVFEASADRVSDIVATLEFHGLTDKVRVRHAAVGQVFQTWGRRGGDGAVSPDDLPNCNVLVMDCEGAERPILRGLTIRPRTIIVEYHEHLGAPRSEVVGGLERLGYSVELLGVESADPDVGIVRGTRR